jgi:hypothetical protein
MVKIDDAAQGKLPCFDIWTKFLLLRYQLQKDAIDARENLWSVASISSSEAYCSKCGNFHLYDINGFGLTSRERLDVHVSYEREPISRYIRREICPECISSNGTPKTIFMDLKDAQDAIDSLTVNLDSPQWAYECPIGNGIHLTKVAPKNSDGQLGKISQKYLSKMTFEVTEVPPPPQSLKKVNVSSQVASLGTEIPTGQLSTTATTEHLEKNAKKTAKEAKLAAEVARQEAKSIAELRRYLDPSPKVGSWRYIEGKKIGKGKLYKCNKCGYDANMWPEESCGQCWESGPFEGPV